MASVHAFPIYGEVESRYVIALDPKRSQLTVTRNGCETTWNIDYYLGLHLIHKQLANGSPCYRALRRYLPKQYTLRILPTPVGWDSVKTPIASYSDSLDSRIEYVQRQMENQN